MNIHKRGIALSGRFCRLEHPTNIHTNTTQGRRQVPQVRTWNHTPPTEEDKYLKYESETTHHPRRKFINLQTSKKAQRHVKLQNITNSSKQQNIVGIKKHINCSRNPLYHKTKTKEKKRRGEQKHTKSQLKLTTPTRKVNNITDLHQQSTQRVPKSISIAADTHCNAQHTESSDSTQWAKQNDSTRQLQNPTNIMEQTPWPGIHEYKPWPGYTQARLLWIHQNHHLHW